MQIIEKIVVVAVVVLAVVGMTRVIRRQQKSEGCEEGKECEGCQLAWQCKKKQ